MAKSRIPTGLVRSQQSSSRCTSLVVIPTGTPVSCHPATGGTAVASGNGVRPEKYRNFSSDRN